MPRGKYERTPAHRLRMKEALARPDVRVKLSAAQLGNQKGRRARPDIVESNRRRIASNGKQSFAAVHVWVRKNFEDPGGCEHCGVQWMRLDWASVGHVYTRNRRDWKRLCRRCHYRMDRGKKAA